jgi:hypothetical protein
MKISNFQLIFFLLLIMFIKINRSYPYQPVGVSVSTGANSFIIYPDFTGTEMSPLISERVLGEEELGLGLVSGLGLVLGIRVLLFIQT